MQWQYGRSVTTCKDIAKPAVIYVQYLIVLCTIPLLRIFPSDIIVGVFRKSDSGR